MSVTGLSVFDATVQKTNAWLSELMETIGSDSRARAYAIFRATLHALRDRLTIEETAQFAAQFPMLLRGLYYEGWDPSGKPVKERRREDFLARMERELTGNEEIDPTAAASAVFAVLARRISAGEIADVKQVLPAEIRSLWPGEGRRAA